MVRAILAGEKTQTRRVVRMLKCPVAGLELVAYDTSDGRPVYMARGDDGQPVAAFPHGRESVKAEATAPAAVGDRLWVRETWGCADADRPGVPGGKKPEPGARIYYPANDADGWQWRDGSLPWRAAIHMPRWACRLVLEVVEVRVERVQAITDDDARSEGVAEYARSACAAGNPLELTPREYFEVLWDTFHERRGYGWHANPWVWVLEFRTVELERRR